jgi:endonuclease/exonuclease/phosphatase family metal-dependent hydrolase
MLSSTPHVQGTFYEGTDQSRCPRIYTKLLLKHRALDEPFWIYNLHTDHQGPIARQMACMQVLQDMSAQRFPAIVTGDFNALPTSKTVKTLLENGKEGAFAKDTFSVLYRLDPENIRTYHGFKGTKKGAPIDYIFATKRLDIISAHIDRTAYGGMYPSDHFPVIAKITVDEACF